MAQCNDEASFVEALRKILSSDQTKKVVVGLLAQIRADKPGE